MEILPSDIQVSIFSRLSVKEVIRCTSVKKLFYKLIHSNFFVDTYNRQSQIYASNPPLIFVKFVAHHKYSFHYESNGKELDKFSPLPLPFQQNPDHFTMVGFDNSIVCLYSHRGKDILLWNPYIQKSLTLPKPYYSPLFPIFGLGFVNETSDYKLLMINDTNKAELYSLQHNCWKFISNPGCFSLHAGNAVCVKESLYWISSKSNTPLMRVFDLNDEVFSEISLPDYWNDVDSLSLHLTKHTEFSIAVIRNGVHDADGYSDGQVMDLVNEKKKWRKYSIQSDSSWTGTMCDVCSNEEGETIVIRGNGLFSRMEQKQFIGYGNAYNYVTNLALLDKAGELSTSSKSRNTGESSRAT